MKISHAHHNSWAKYSQELSDLITRTSNAQIKHRSFFRKLRPFQQFSAWPLCPKRNISALSGYTLAPRLNFKTVEQFFKTPCGTRRH